MRFATSALAVLLAAGCATSAPPLPAPPVERVIRRGRPPSRDATAASVDAPPVDLRLTAEPRSRRPARIEHPTRTDRYIGYTVAADLAGYVAAFYLAFNGGEWWMASLGALPSAIVHVAHGQGEAALIGFLIRATAYTIGAGIMDSARRADDLRDGISILMGGAIVAAVGFGIGMTLDVRLARREVPVEGWWALPALEPRSPLVPAPAATAPASAPTPAAADEPSDRSTSIR